MVQDIEIIGSSTCGTYPTWIDYCVASFYNHVDKVVIVNGGYDIDHPEKGAIIPLKREHNLLKNIDINNKIIEIVPTQDQIDKIFNSTCKQGKDEFGRSTSMTLSTQIAHNLPNPNNKTRWILKLDSDQILHKITRDQLTGLLDKYPEKTGFRFSQYAGYYNDFDHIDYIPDEFTNDGALFYISLENQGYCGQGSPGNIKVEQYPINSIRTAHMRRINPPDIDPYEYHYKRLWYHTYGPNSIMEHEYNRSTGKKLTYEEIKEIAQNSTSSTLNNKGIDISSHPFDERIPYNKPLVCEIGPLEYIKRGY